MGLIDPEIWDELLRKSRELSASDAPQPGERRGNMLMSMGAGLLAGGQQPFGSALGNAALMGMASDRQFMQDRRKDPAAQIALMQGMLGIQRGAEDYQLAQRRRAAYGDQPNTPSAGPVSPMPMGSSVGGGNEMGDMQQMPQFAQPPMQQPAMQQPQGMPTRNLTYNTIIAQAEKMRRAGLGEDYLKLLEQAEKYRPKSAGLETLMQNGKRVRVQRFEDGTVAPVEGFEPDAEKLSFHDNGSAILGLDPFTGEQLSRGIAKTVTPGEAQTDQRSREQFAQTQNLAERQFRDTSGRGWAGLNQSERHFNTTQAQPHFIDTGNGFLGVDRASMVGRPVVDESGAPVNSQKPLTESQAKAYAFGSRMEQSSQVLNRLEAETKLFDPSSPVNKMAGSSGVWAPMNYMAPQKAQSYMQAAKNWSEAELRFKSGAAVTPKEIDNNVAIYFPMPGDGLETIQQKARARAVAEQSMRVVMGQSGNAQMSTGRQDPLKLRRREDDPLGLR